MGREYLAIESASSAGRASAGGGAGDELLPLGGTTSAAFGPFGPVLAPPGARSPRDRWAAVAYGVVLAAAMAGGLYAAVNHNQANFGAFDPAYLAKLSSCPSLLDEADDGGGARKLLGAGGRDAPAPAQDLSVASFLATVGAYGALSALVGLALGAASVSLYRAKPRAAVYGAVALQVALPLAGALAVLASGGPAFAAAPLLLVAGIVACVYYLYRSRLGLVAQLLGTAAQAVSHVWGVVVAAAGVHLASAIVSLPLAAGLALAYASGSVVPSPLVAGVVEVSSISIDASGVGDSPAALAAAVTAAAAADAAGNSTAAASTSFECLTADERPTSCCQWRPAPWAGAVVALCSLALLWTALLASCVTTYVVSGAVAAWYYSPAGGGGGGGAREGLTGTALRNALGPGFGTSALAALAVAAIRWARSALQQLRELLCESCMGQAVTSFFDVALAALEQLSKFGVVFAAITGDAFFAAARRSTALLSRNLLDTVAVWAFPGGVFFFTNLAIAFVWSWVAGLSSYKLVYAPAPGGGGGSGGDSDPLAALLAMTTAYVALAVALVALCFMSLVLLSAVDAVYLCFAIDRDRAQVTREGVHAVMALLPAAAKKSPPPSAAGGGDGGPGGSGGPGGGGPGGGIVEHPGGGLAFGAERGGGAPPPPQTPTAV